MLRATACMRAPEFVFLIPDGCNQHKQKKHRMQCSIASLGYLSSIPDMSVLYTEARRKCNMTCEVFPNQYVLQRRMKKKPSSISSNDLKRVRTDSGTHDTHTPYGFGHDQASIGDQDDVLGQLVNLLVPPHLREGPGVTRVRKKPVCLSACLPACLSVWWSLLLHAALCSTEQKRVCH